MSGYHGRYYGSDDDMTDVPEYYKWKEEEDEEEDYGDDDGDEYPVDLSQSRSAGLWGPGGHGGPPPPQPAAARHRPAAPKKCRTCGNPGHNSRNCAINKGFLSKKKEQAAPPPPPPPPPPPKASKLSKPDEKACGACRETGHDRRTCPRLQDAAPQDRVITVTTTTTTTLAKSSPAKSSKATTKPTKQPAKKSSKPPAASSAPAKRTLQTARCSRGDRASAPVRTSAAASRPIQTARRGKPLGARGSRGGGGIIKGRRKEEEYEIYLAD